MNSRLKDKLINGWGKWRFDPGHRILVHERGYEMDLESMTTSAEMLDWVFQIHGKTWGQADMGDLIDALDDLFYPQATLCSGGIEQGPRKYEDCLNPQVTELLQLGIVP